MEMDAPLKLTSIRDAKERRQPTADAPSTAGRAWPAMVLALASAGLAVWAAALSSGGREYVRAALVAAWALAAGFVALRRPAEPLGRLAGFGALTGGLAAASAAVLRSDVSTLHGAAEYVRAFSLALIPAAGLHLMIGLPDGRPDTLARRALMRAGYVAALGLGAGLLADRASPPLWPVAVAGAVSLAIGFGTSRGRYFRSRGRERQRLQWFGLAVTFAGSVAVLAGATNLLLKWPPEVAPVAAGATIAIPAAIAIGASRGFVERVDRLLTAAVSLAGLGGVVFAVYLAVVVGLGRVPAEDERTLLLLSMVAAGVTALLYLPARQRLQGFANRLVYGERRAPDDVLRTFGSRLSRAVPLDELLLQVAESLRKTLALQAAEVWTAGASGGLERTVSSPERTKAPLRVSPTEEPVVARAGVSGPAWIKVWLPGLMAGREEAVMRVAPATHSGELLGLIVAERPPDAEQFTAEDERVMGELARQVGLVLHNVRLDSALQASLDELRRHAEELRASRARIVATADAERRRIERNLHDGAQQHLVALSVKLRLVRQLADADLEQAKEMLQQLGTDVQETLHELRALAHGIFPPLLADRGLPEALRAAAGRAVLPTDVEAEGIGRYSQDVETAVYFCCLEALQNAGKHAGEGATATIRVWEEEGGLLFEVADTGAGFDLATAARSAGFVNMQDRVGAIGGTVRVDSEPGRGTRILGAIPVPGRKPH